MGYFLLAQGTYKTCEWKVEDVWGSIRASVKVPVALQKRRRDFEALPFFERLSYMVDKRYSSKKPNQFDLWIEFRVCTFYYENSLDAGKAECKKLIDALIELKEKIKKEEMEQLAKKLKSKV